LEQLAKLMLLLISEVIQAQVQATRNHLPEDGGHLANDADSKLASADRHAPHKHILLVLIKVHAMAEVTDLGLDEATDRVDAALGGGARRAGGALW